MTAKKCPHLLFDYEADYIICPDCGEPLAQNMPDNPVLKLEVIRRSRLYKKMLSWKKYSRFFFFLILMVSLLYPCLEGYIIERYHIAGLSSFEPYHMFYFYPFQEIGSAAIVLLVFLGGPHYDGRKWTRMWHLPRQAYFFQASRLRFFVKTSFYLLLAYLGSALWAELIYLEEFDRIKHYLSGQDLVYACKVYARENLRGLYIVLTLYFLADCWLFFYQRLAVRVNRSLE